MSFRTPVEAPARAHRSELAVPASRPELFEKAARGAADAVFLDLEDAVAPDEKDRARDLAVTAIRDVDWGTKTLAVRINGLDTPYWHRDVIALAAAGPRLDVIMLPKAGDPRDLYALDALLTAAEADARRPARLALGAVIETALGMSNVEAIAHASPRLESLHLGVADYAASTRMRTVNIGGPNPDYASGAAILDPWHYALCRVIVAARAAGLRPLDGPYGDFRDPDGMRAASLRARALGAEGKMAIHPSQVAVANAVFAPDPAEITRAQRVLDAMAQAQREGRGAVALDGRMLDLASIRQAEALLGKARVLGLVTG